MYQPPRPSARAAGSATSSPRTNPHRSNHDRDRQPDSRKSSFDPASSLNRASGDSSSELGSSQSMDDRQIEQARESQKLNQIIQQFFVKGALTIVSSRVSFPKSYTKSGAVRENKWFNILIEDSDELMGLTAEWKTLRVEDGMPPPLTIEIYLDLSELTRSQSLVIIDDDGKRWNVADALNPPGSRSHMGKRTELVLERWEFSMDDSSSSPDGDTLSNVYKRCIPVFRSLYCHSRLLPAWKYCRRVATQLSHNTSNPALKPKYRVVTGRPPISKIDPMDVPLHPIQGNLNERFVFGQLLSPAGTMRTTVKYRTNCDFRVDDSEAILSSHFMGLDEHYFKPSLSGRNADTNQAPGSAPAMKKDYMEEARDHDQTYGSMSTFHNAGPRHSSSPMSALRALTDRGSATPPQKVPSHPRMPQGASPRSNDTAPSYQRRPSVSFNPFKSPSLASSPANYPLSPSSSVGRSSNLAPFAHRSRNSLTTLPQVILRTPNIPNETAVASSGSSSPKPAPLNRYSSSFSHRRSRFSSGGGSKGDDDNSSGKASAASSAQPESEVLNDGRGDGSSSSVQQTDDENLKDFIALLEQKKDLKSFSRSDSAARDASMRQTTARLSKYQRMKESNAQLSDSMTSSLLLHRSSSSSSRQLSSVPPMIGGTSVSTASSPGKPISPHTPHTPAIPSRLSANSIIDYGGPAEPRRSRSHAIRERETETAREEDSSDSTSRDTGTTAIDIPTSPRPWAYGRRSSSVNQRQNRGIDDGEEYVHRSASLPVDERMDLSLLDNAPRIESSNLADEKGSGRLSSEEQSPAVSTVEAPRRIYSATPDPPGPNYRSRLSRNSTSRRGSPSFVHSYSPSSSAQGPAAATDRFTSTERGGFGGRYSPSSRNSIAQDDDEPFIFTMSEIGAAGSRRSLEEGRASVERKSGRATGSTVGPTGRN